MNNIEISQPRTLLNTRYAIVALLLCSLVAIQCKKNTVATGSSAKLSFSTNLLFFDTVFSTLGSTVRVFVVHNNNNQAVNISSISLQGLYPSYYKINVDGVSGSTFNNVQIPAKDSIYVFATVTVDPTNQNSPLEINDSLVFVTNGNVQSVQLQAFGQDAYIYLPDTFPATGPAYYALTCGDEWKNDKPHVIFGYVVVQPGCTLTIDAGAAVYLHDSAVLYIDSSATLNVNGTESQPVTFQQDRLEPDYNYIPGQWNEIFMYKPSNCKVSWAVLQNGESGFEVDTVFNGVPAGQPALSMDHTIIKNMSSYGVFLAGTTAKADDCLIADCQYSCVFLWIGGSYEFNQCTFADYWGVYNSYSQRTTSLLYMNNYYQTADNITIVRPINEASFGNCIIYGALDEEVTMDTVATGSGGNFNYYFANCEMKTKHSTAAGIHYDDSIYLADPSFYGPATDDYRINTGSPAIGNANPGIAQYYPVPLDGGARPAIGATIGAYEQ